MKNQKIALKITPPGKMRFSTAGDYYTDKRGRLLFEIMDVGRNDYIICLLVHELVEKALCMKRGITDAVIDAWDFTYEGDGEPGEQKGAPYRREHNFATRLEKMLARELGINWKDYDRVLTHASSMSRTPSR